MVERITRPDEIGIGQPGGVFRQASVQYVNAIPDAQAFGARRHRVEQRWGAIHGHYLGGEKRAGQHRGHDASATAHIEDAIRADGAAKLAQPGSCLLKEGLM